MWGVRHVLGGINVPKTMTGCWDYGGQHSPVQDRQIRGLDCGELTQPHVPLSACVGAVEQRIGDKGPAVECPPAHENSSNLYGTVHASGLWSPLNMATGHNSSAQTLYLTRWQQLLRDGHCYTLACCVRYSSV